MNTIATMASQRPLHGTDGRGFVGRRFGAPDQSSRLSTMPGNDVTHPVPDNTGYITEGQFYLHDAMIDPFGSLSRLKQNVIGSATREDHGQLMNTMIRLYASGKEAQQKQAMAFDLSAYDHKLIKFADAFTDRFMALDVSMPLEQALDVGWQTVAECFEPQELLMKQALLDKYFPHQKPSAGAVQSAPHA